MPIKLCLATTNTGKILEISQTLQQYIKNITLLSLDDFNIHEPEEPYNTFLENAMHKAQYYGQKTGCLCLADDSGLCITALNNFPGVHTKDFMFSCKTQEIALSIINEKLMETPDRSATFYSAIAIYDPHKDQMIHHQDTHTGNISTDLRGEIRPGMFFDTMFIPQGSSETLGELPLKIKNTIGHRAKALKVISSELLKYYR